MTAKEAAERTVDPTSHGEAGAEEIRRPQTFEEFVGQKTLCSNLRTFIDSALQRSAALDHVLLWAHRGWVRQPSPKSLPVNSVLASV